MSKAVYDRPRIVRQQIGILNDFSRTKNKYVAEIDGVSVAELVRQHGSPLFVFSESTLRRTIGRMHQAFTSKYPRVRFAWSYKTNYLDAICAIFHQAGWDAEVVSDLEYAMARRAGLPGNRIVCNGAYKQAEWCRLAAEDGALIQIDHVDEIDLLARIAAGRPAPLPVGLRVNMSVDTMGPMWNRFGFNLENGEAFDAVVRLLGSPQLLLAGLHCHLGTFITNAEVFQKAIRKLCAFAINVEKAIGRRLDFLNMGGGLPSSNSLTGGDSESDREPDFSRFADAISGEMHRAFEGRDPPPELVMEAGRALVDEAGLLIATVVGTRRLSSGERGVVLDAGINVVYTAHWYQHRIVPADDVPGSLEPTSVHGPLCMNIDALRRSVMLPPLEAGHRVVISPVGAYNVTQWMQFSQLRPAVVLIGEGGSVQVIRRAETIDDVKGPEGPSGA